jgi:peptidoglycan/xylan/chitin deacetylase (PgdA/CDA1 family)
MSATHPPVWSSPKRLARAVLSTAPVYTAMRSRALREQPVTALTYHALGADDEDFDAWIVVRQGDFLRQVELLRRTYDVVSLDEAVKAHTEGRPSAKPRAVITFDDGHESLHRYLLPIVEREQLPVTVYIATGHIATGQSYWFDRVMNALQTSSAFVLDLGDQGLGRWTLGATRGESNWRVVSDVLQSLKGLSPERREAVTGVIVERMAAAPRPRFRPLSPMSMAQLKELAASRWVTLGAHTHCHNLLDQLSLQQASASIAQSRDLLKAWTGRPVDHFAYPNGNHNGDLVREVEALGFASAFTAEKGLWPRGTSRYAASRIAVGRYDDLPKFKLDLVGGLRRG